MTFTYFSGRVAGSVENIVNSVQALAIAVVELDNIPRLGVEYSTDRSDMFFNGC